MKWFKFKLPKDLGEYKPSKVVAINSIEELIVGFEKKRKRRRK